MFKEEANYQEENIARQSAAFLPDIKKLKKKFSGKIILPGDSLYDELSETFTKKGAPALVVQPFSSSDVSAAVKYANANSLTISIRSGGHGSPGFATNNGGMVIDLFNINKIEVIDKSNGIVRVGAGAKWGDVAKELERYNLAISSGDTKSVGVGGLTLGGGIGWMVRKYGLTIDSLLAADVVTSDGNILHLSDKENSDLFWAIKGGGGNFCIVTDFEFIARTISKVVFGTIQYGMEELQSVLTGWSKYMEIADENLNSSVRIMPSLFGMQAGIYILVCYAGSDDSHSQQAIEPLLKLGKVIQQNIKEMNYADVLEEPMHPPAHLKIVIKNMFARELGDGLIGKVCEMFGKDNSPVIQIRSINGANNRIASDATAFAFRDSKIIIVAGIFVPASITESELEKVMIPLNLLSEESIGTYVNFISEDENINDIYPEATYNRLLQVKQKYDPQNILNQNYNIKP